jgi:hypothetical protein
MSILVLSPPTLLSNLNVFTYNNTITILLFGLPLPLPPAISISMVQNDCGIDFFVFFLLSCGVKAFSGRKLRELFTFYTRFIYLFGWVWCRGEESEQKRFALPPLDEFKV